MSIANTSRLQQWLYDVKLHKPFIFAFTFILYANTLGHQFVLDDGIVITENKFVKKGISGIPDLLSNDSFYGFFKVQGKEKLVAGGRYRPMSMILFALVYQVFESVPFVFHMFSIAMYALLGFILYKVMGKLLQPKFGENAVLLALFVSVLFLAHPVHTECVANIKGMDETCALLLSLFALYLSLLYIDNRKPVLLIGVFISFLCGLLSKENAIAYLGIIPLALYFLYTQNKKIIAWLCGSLLLATIVFLFMRAQVLGLNPFGQLSKELMNNPFIKVTNGVSQPMNFIEKAGIITYSLFEYLRLLIFPHPLTHDYYPKQIPMLGLTSLQSIIALVSYGSMILFALLGIKKNPLTGLSIAFFLLPLFLVSNILFPIGTNMGERFLFMPSLGFALGLSYLLLKLSTKNSNVGFYVFLSIALLYSIKTISRNPAWYDNMTLFQTDVITSANSAKIHNAIAGVMLEKVPSLNDTAEIKKITTKARVELQKALQIHPLYMEAHLQMGNIFYYEKDYESAIGKYNQVLKALPEDEDAFKNMQMALRERGRQIGMQTGNVQLAKEYLGKSMGMNPQDAEAIMLMGIAEGTSGNFDKALHYFNKATAVQPSNAQAWFNLGITYKNLGNAIQADSMFQKAKQLDPEIYKKNGMPSK